MWNLYAISNHLDDASEREKHLCFNGFATKAGALGALNGLQRNNQGVWRGGSNGPMTQTVPLAQIVRFEILEE